MPDIEPIDHEIQFYAPRATDWTSLVGGNGAQTPRETLQATMLASLQMQHIAALAGSGCSFSAGGPSMSDLWDECLKQKPSKTISTIAKKVNFDIESSQNIEEFLSRIEACLQVREEKSLREFLIRCKFVILKMCTEFLEDDGLKAHKTFLHRLSRRRARDSRLKIFTTNYDLSFERAASNLGIFLIDGFSFGRPRLYDPRYFGYDIVRRSSSDESTHFLEGVFLLYKLHGSVNWARKADHRIVEKFHPKPEEACMIYPAVGKYQQAFLQPHLETISQFMTALRQPNTCFIVAGFGFNDNHLSEPLLAAVRSNPHMRLIVADYGAKAKCASSENGYWKELFELSKRGEDIWFINCGFDELADLIPDLRALTPAEKLMKAVQGIASDRSQ